MNPREHPIAPSQQAINGALDMYVEGGKKDNAQQMLFGLSVLRHATGEQIQVALPVVQASQQMSSDEIKGMLEHYGENAVEPKRGAAPTPAPSAVPPTATDRNWENEGGTPSSATAPATPVRERSS